MIRTANQKTVCYHEAGHAVMVALSPYHLPGETIIGQEKTRIGVSNGQSHYQTIQYNDVWEWRIAAGGGAGEKILNPKADVFGFGEGFVHPTAGRLDLVTCGADPYNTLGTGDPEVTLRREKRALHEVCKMVRDRAEAVHRIASILLHRGRITSAEVRAIVGSQLEAEQPPKAKPVSIDPRQVGLFDEVLP